MKRAKGRSGQRGVTLIETMISMGILGIGIAGMMQLYQSVLAGMRSSTAFSQAMEVARHRVEQFSGMDLDDVNGFGCNANPPGCQADGGRGYTTPNALPECTRGVDQAAPFNAADAENASGRFRVDVSVLDHAGTGEGSDRLMVVSVCWRDGDRIRQLQTRKVLLPSETL